LSTARRQPGLGERKVKVSKKYLQTISETVENICQQNQKKQLRTIIKAKGGICVFQEWHKSFSYEHFI